MPEGRLKLFIDGASRGNPGPAGIGIVIQDQDGRVVAEVAEFLGEATNNVAEYQALLRALAEAAARGAEEVEVFADSELLVRQISGAYRVRNAALAALHAAAIKALRGFRRWRIEHVPRAENAAADRLANRVLDRPHNHPPPDTGAGLQAGLEQVARRLDGVLGVGVKAAWAGTECYLEPDRPFPTASVFKIPVLIELMVQAEEGRVSLDERVAVTEDLKAPGSGVLKELTSAPQLTLADLAVLMTIVSDNTATDILVERVGIEALNRRLASWGFEVTRVAMTCRQLLFELAGRPEGPFTPEGRLEVERLLKARERIFTGRLYAGSANNVSTPREMTRLLEMLVADGLLSPWVREQALRILRRQQIRDRLPLHLPPTVEIAHKTGSIAGVRNDAGILFAARGPVLVCAFTRDLKADLDGASAIAHVGRIVYDAFA